MERFVRKEVSIVLSEDHWHIHGMSQSVVQTPNGFYKATITRCTAMKCMTRTSLFLSIFPLPFALKRERVPKAGEGLTRGVVLGKWLSIHVNDPGDLVFIHRLHEFFEPMLLLVSTFRRKERDHAIKLDHVASRTLEQTVCEKKQSRKRTTLVKRFRRVLVRNQRYGCA